MAYKVIRQGEGEFHFVDGWKLVPRASFEISELCPTSMRLMIERAIGEGYIKTIAYVPDAEYAWEKLQS
jgi:hypothetical protein